MNYSNMTNGEVYRLTGTLPASRIEKLLNLEAAFGEYTMEQVRIAAEESMNVVPEDFMVKFRELLSECVKEKYKKDILEQFDQEIQKVERRSEYADTLLKDSVMQIEGIIAMMKV